MTLKFREYLRKKIQRAPRLGLRSPTFLKLRMRWAINRRNRFAYVLVLSWPTFLIASIATVTIFFAKAPEETTPWLFYLKIFLSGVLAWIYAIDGATKPIQSWRRRHASQRQLP
jgi:hypothetical protein